MKIVNFKKIALSRFFVYSIIFLSSCYCDSEKTKFQNGDIIFQTSLSSQSKAIQLATNSKFSHMGIVYITTKGVFVFEASNTVQLTPINAWISRGEKQQYVIKRLRNSPKILSFKILEKMKLVGDRFSDKHYDPYFEWSNDRFYCSELVWKIYKEATGLAIGKLHNLKEYNISNPTVQEKLKERYGNKIPLDEIVITPNNIYESELLYTVYSNY